MKKLNLAVTALALILLASSSGFAATKKKKTDKTADQQRADITVPVPAQVLDFTGIEAEAKKTKVTHIEFTLSTWQPSNFVQDSYLSNTGTFHSIGAGKIGANIWNDSWYAGPMVISPKFGFGFEQFARTGEVTVANQPTTVTENLNLYSANIGLEVAPISDLRFHLQPFFDLNVMPTIAQAPVGQFDNGISSTFWNVQEMAGLAWHAPWLASATGTSAFGLELGVEATQALTASPLAGFGIVAGTRIDL